MRESLWAFRAFLWTGTAVSGGYPLEVRVLESRGLVFMGHIDGLLDMYQCFSLCVRTIENNICTKEVEYSCFSV